MNWKRELAIMAGLVAVFAAVWWMPVGEPRFGEAVEGSLRLTQWYAREHILLCLIPAFFIAGAIAVFVSKVSVMKYLGANANKVLAYGVASVSGSILAVCSCTVLPLFAGIWRRGAGLGPATAFLYSGPAINVLAIILTARVLGMELGVARTIGAVVFSIVIGLLMQFIFRRGELVRLEAAVIAASADPISENTRPLWKTALFFAAMIAFLVFANWSRPNETHPGPWQAIFSVKWYLAGGSLLALATMIVLWFNRSELVEWLVATWSFTKQIAPLLLGGILVSGFLLGGPSSKGIIPAEWISDAVGGDSLGANFIASLVGALMYFATLTEVPILRGLMDDGMGQGPALALLLAGPALSLPSMIVLASVMGTKKMLVYVGLVVVMATATGMIYGALV
jgi:uncharacterized protein